MIRAEEIRDTLLRFSDPFEACRELTERANAAGGHDNITVIVGRFEEGLPEVAETDAPLGYRKYALPESADAEATVKAPSLTPNAMPTSLAAETKREGRGLPPSGGAAPAQHPGGGMTPPTDFAPIDDDPVQIPTTGLPPAAVGFMVLGAMVAVAVMGFLLLR
jgi:protein phosphatase